MDSYRLIINNYDESSVTAVDTSDGAIGYTVVTSPKGSHTPMLISSVADLHKYFGYPSKDYPELFEAETFIANGHKLYVCSAGGKNTGAKDEDTAHSGAKDEDTAHFIVVCDEGNFLAEKSFTYDDEIKDFINTGDATETCSNLESAIKNNDSDNSVKVLYKLYSSEAQVGKSSSSATSVDSLFFVLGDAKEYVTVTQDEKGNNVYTGATITSSTNIPMSFNLSGVVGSEKTSYDITRETGSAELMIDSSNIGEVVFYSSTTCTASTTASDTFNKIALKITGDPEGTATGTLKKDNVTTIIGNYNQRKNLVLSETKDITTDKIKAIIFPREATTKNIKVNISLPEATSGTEKIKDPEIRNRLTLTVTGDFSGEVVVSGSLNPADASYASFNEDTNSAYAQSPVVVYTGGAYFVNGDFVDSAEIKEENVENTVTITAGTRAEWGAETVEDAWAYASDSAYDDVNVFFDSQKHVVGDGNTASLNGGFSSLVGSRPLCGFIYNKTVKRGEVDSADTCSLGHNFWTITGLKRFTVTDENGAASAVESPMTGAYAAMICKIIDSAYGGMAPMFLNSNGMGGQLSFPVGVSKDRVVYNYSSNEQKALEKKNYNPIIYDNTYGTMVTAQRTNAAGVLTDWSYIGHVCSFLTFQREVRTNIMIPQLGKANNDYYRSLRAEQVSQLLRLRLEGSNAIWNAATVDTSTNTGVNDTQAQKAKKFIINVRVKPEPYSEYVVLNFTNYNDSSTSEATAV